MVLQISANMSLKGDRGGTVVNALCYKSEVAGSIQSALSSRAERLCLCESIVECYVRRSSVVVCDGEL